jgi:hypothetical protein
MRAIGHLVWWKIDHPVILREKFNELVRQHDINVFVTKAKPRWAFTTALTHIKKKLSGREWHIQKIKQENFRKWYGIYDPIRTDVWDDLEMKQAATIEFNMRTGELTCDWPHKSFEYFKKAYTWFCNSVSSDDLCEWALRVIDSTTGIAVRKGGIIYFVPHTDDKIVRSLYTIINGIPKRCWCATIPQVDSTELKNTINRFFLHAVTRQIEEYRWWIYPKVRTIDITDVDMRLKKIYDFRKKLLLYNDLTSFDHAPYIELVNEAIKRYRARREEIYIKSPTKLQQMKYKHNKREYPDE